MPTTGRRPDAAAPWPIVWHGRRAARRSGSRSSPARRTPSIFPCRPASTSSAITWRTTPPLRRRAWLLSTAFSPSRGSARRNLARPRDVFHDRAIRAMRARQISQAHQELAGNLAAGEFEALAEQFHPIVLRELALRIEPGGKTAMALAQGLHPPCVLDDRDDLQPVADHGRVGEQARDVLLREARDLVDGEALERPDQSRPALQDQLPAQPGLEDLEAEPLEQHRLVAAGEAVFRVVIGAVQRMAGGDVAIAAHG